MNRHERRKAARLYRAGNRSLKLRCAGCDRVGQRMTKEHFFPSWLIEYTEAQNDSIRWVGKERTNPASATMPLCDDCNNALANTLEGPVSLIFRALETAEALSDLDAELLVRWMWKFEGLQWHLLGHDATACYSDRYTLVERVTNPRVFEEIRPRMLLALAMCHTNDEGFVGWPLGLDTMPGDSALTMSGVFRRVAIITSLVDFADVIPDMFGKYAFGNLPTDRIVKSFVPPCSFVTANAAIEMTRKVAAQLTKLHDEFAAETWREHAAASPGRSVIPVRKRIELPPV
jgi:hypothetical protein